MLLTPALPDLKKQLLWAQEVNFSRKRVKDAHPSVFSINAVAGYRGACSPASPSGGFLVVLVNGSPCSLSYKL